MSVHYLRVLNFTQNFLKIPAFLSQLTSVFFLYVSEAWNGTVSGVLSIYMTSVIFPSMVDLATPIDTQSKVTVFTLVYSLPPPLVFAAENLLSFSFTFLFCGRYSSWKVAS